MPTSKVTVRVHTGQSFGASAKRTPGDSPVAERALEHPPFCRSAT